MHSAYADALETVAYLIAWAVLIPTWLMVAGLAWAFVAPAVTACLLPDRRLHPRWEWLTKPERSRSPWRS